MQKHAYSKPVLALLCILLVLVPFLSTWLAATHSDHDCTQTQCVLCAVIASARVVLRLLTLVACAIMLALAIQATMTAYVGRAALRQKAPTLFLLKTRLNP